MMGRILSRRAAGGHFGRFLVIGLVVAVCAAGAWAAPQSGPADAGQKPDELARAAADRFGHAVDRADVAAAAAECSLPWLNSNRDIAGDDAALKTNLGVLTDLPRRFPQAGASYRGVDASLPFDRFRAALDAHAPKLDAEGREQVQNLDILKLTPADRVVM